VLTYVVLPDEVVEAALFQGIASADGVSSRIGGDRVLTTGKRHPADRAPADNSIKADELTAYAAAWKTGRSWPPATATDPSSPTDANLIPMNYVTRAALLWREGEHYSFDGSMAPPLCWIPAGAESDGPTTQAARTAPLTGVATRERRSLDSGGSQIVITLRPAPGTRAFAVEERLPEGSTPAAIEGGGIWSVATRTLRWGPFYSEESPVLSYRVNTGNSPQGVASFDGQSVSIRDDSAPSGDDGRLTGIDLLADGSHQVSLKAPALAEGTEYELQASSDLKSWHSLGRFQANAEVGFARDWETIGQAPRFYRAVRLP
jgi:hypothetical protein